MEWTVYDDDRNSAAYLLLSPLNAPTASFRLLPHIGNTFSWSHSPRSPRLSNFHAGSSFAFTFAMLTLSIDEVIACNVCKLHNIISGVNHQAFVKGGKEGQGSVYSALLRNLIGRLQRNIARDKRKGGEDDCVLTMQRFCQKLLH